MDWGFRFPRAILLLDLLLLFVYLTRHYAVTDGALVDRMQPPRDRRIYIPRVSPWQGGRSRRPGRGGLVHERGSEHVALGEWCGQDGRMRLDDFGWVLVVTSAGSKRRRRRLYNLAGGRTNSAFLSTRDS